MANSTAALTADGPFAVGGTPGLANDATAALQAAVDAAHARGDAQVDVGEPTVRAVRVGAGRWSVRAPVFVPDGVDVRGSGWDTLLYMPNALRYPMLVFGVKDPGCTAADRPDLYGVLDATACPRPGARRGFAAGRCFLQLHAFDLTYGLWHDPGDGRCRYDYLADRDVLTFDAFLLRDPGNPWGPAQPLFGLGRSCDVALAGPVVFQTHESDPDVVRVYSRDDTQAGEWDRSHQAWDVPVGAAAALRLTFQVDHGAGTCHAWVNGVQAPAYPRGAPAPGGRRFRPNIDMPFMVAAQGPGKDAGDGRPNTPFTLCGLKVSKAAVYAPGEPGGPRRRRDGRADTDALTYFRGDADTLAYFPLDDPVGRRWLQVVGNDGRPGAALVVGPGQGGGRPNQLRDIGLQADGGCVLLGAVLDFRAENVRALASCGPAFGSVPVTNAYAVDLVGCTLASHDTCVHGHRWVQGTLDRVVFAQVGLDGYRLSGCSLAVREASLRFTTDATQAFGRYLPFDAGGSQNLVDGAMLDTESGGFTEAAFVAHQDQTGPNELWVRRVRCGYTGPTRDDHRPLVRLHNAPGARASAVSRAAVEGAVTPGCAGVVAADPPREGSAAGWAFTDDSVAANPD